MSKFYRKKHPDIGAITTATMIIEVNADQVFMETPKAWELWQKDPLQRLKRWSKERVFWILEGRRQ